MKTSRLIAVSAAAAAILFSACSDPADSSVPPNPVVNLPASVGENPFKGKTFGEGDLTGREDYNYKYVFSPDGTTLSRLWHDSDVNGFVEDGLLRCSVDAEKKELYMATEKIRAGWGTQKLYTFRELVEYAQSDERLKDYEAELRKELDDGNITQEQFDEYLKGQEEWIDEEIASGFQETASYFSGMLRYSYTYEDGAVELVRQFNESDGGYSYFICEWQSGVYAVVCWVGSLDASMELGRITFSESDSKFEDQSFSRSDKRIVFANKDDKSDTFEATYTLTGSGNDTKLNLSFEYKGKSYNPTLDFDPDEMYWREIKE